MLNTRAEVWSVNKSRDRTIYQSASQGYIGLMYTTQEHAYSARDIPLSDHLGEFWVPPDKSLPLYELICNDTPSSDIVSRLALERMSPYKVGDMVEGWLRERHTLSRPHFLSVPFVPVASPPPERSRPGMIRYGSPSSSDATGENMTWEYDPKIGGYRERSLTAQERIERRLKGIEDKLKK